jgi:hypothetical protein
MKYRPDIAAARGLQGFVENLDFVDPVSSPGGVFNRLPWR